MKYELYDEKVFEDDDCVGERGSLFHSCTKKNLWRLHQFSYSLKSEEWPKTKKNVMHSTESTCTKDALKTEFTCTKVHVLATSGLAGLGNFCESAMVGNTEELQMHFPLPTATLGELCGSWWDITARRIQGQVQGLLYTLVTGKRFSMIVPRISLLAVHSFFFWTFRSEFPHS